MGKRHRRAHLASYLVLMAHLLKWQYQPQRRSRSWSGTIERERLRIERREEQSRILERAAWSELQSVYARARQEAALQTELPLTVFPVTCPYTMFQLRDRHFMPE